MAGGLLIMIKRNNMKITAIFLIMGSSLLTGCGNQNTMVQKQPVTTEVNTETSTLKVNYEEDDYYTSWNENEVTQINLGESIEVNGLGVSVQDSILTISSGGTYIISGTLADGQIIVNSDTKDTVRLVLNGAKITSSNSVPIYIKDAGKVVVSLEEGTENMLVDGESYILETDGDEPDATLFSKADLTINGTGTLTIDANYKDAIASKDTLKIVEGNIIVDAADDGIRGKDLVAIKDGNVTITAAGDGIKSTNMQDQGMGFVCIENGVFNITVQKDAIQAETDLEIVDGTFNLITGGGSENGENHMDTMMTPGGMNFQQGGGTGTNGQTMPEMPSGEVPADRPTDMPEIPSGEVPADRPTDMPALPNGEAPTDTSTIPSGEVPADRPTDMPALPNGEVPTEESTVPSGETSVVQSGESETTVGSLQESANTSSTESSDTATDEESTSSKAIKAGKNIVINSGEFTIDSADDAIHGGEIVEINNGNFNITTGDDGIHSDLELVINNGIINIIKSYEGLEGEKITVQAGEIYVKASDDGINAAESTGTENSTGDLVFSKGTAELIINGGYLYVDADGDGLDSNGSIVVNDGTVIVNGPTNGANGALDYDTTCNVNGGTFITAGSSQMAQAISNSSTQNAVNITFPMTQEIGQNVSILDEEGNVVAAFTPSKAFQTVLISSPAFEEGKTYTYAYGGTAEGKVTDGLSQDGTYTNGTVVTEFTISDIITYFNESGVTTQSTNGMMGGHGQVGGRGQKPQNTGTTQRHDQTNGAQNTMSQETTTVS